MSGGIEVERLNMNCYELEPEDNHFYTILADITHKCNMNCNNCYIPNRSIPDMDKVKLFSLLERLPSICDIRLIGAEPTMRDDLPEIVSKIRKLKHKPSLVTNGLKLSNLDYVKVLKEATLIAVAISLNGGSDDKIYRKIDGGCFGKKKIKALENLVRTGFFVQTNTILVKGINENTPLEIYKILKELKVKKAIMRFKNVGPLGRHMSVSKEKNYTYNELIQLIATIFNLDKDWILNQNKYKEYKENNMVFFPLEESEHCSIHIKITDWTNLMGNTRRGRITKNFKIAPAFEHIKMNEFGY